MDTKMPNGFPKGFLEKPELSAAIPGHYYYDPEIYALERVKLFYATWQYAGHVSMFGAAGSYAVREVAGQSVIIIKDRDRQLKAFFNVCQHRAHRLLEGEGTLNSALITCPYHAWSYDLAGHLKGMRGTERMTCFDKSAISLKSIPLRSFLGFLFVNLDGKAPDFDAVTGALAAEVASFSPNAASLKCVYRNEYTLKANWKNSVENFSECFHCPIRHPTLVESAFEYSSYRITTHEHYHSHRSHDKGEAVGYSSRTAAARRTDEFGGWLLWPNWCIEVYPGGNLTIFHHVPVDPETTVQRIEWYFPNDPPTSEEQEVIDFVHTVRLEDIPICESVQKGLHSLGYGRGHFVVDDARSEISEHAVHDFQAKLLRALRG